MGRRVTGMDAPIAPAALAALVALGAVTALALSACTRSDANATAAQHYLDGRASQWVAFRDAARAQGTVCISCHTALPYLLASDARALHRPRSIMPAPQARLLSSVVKRVQLGGRRPPYYPDQAVASRATEAVLNALVLTDRDAATGRLSTAAQEALTQMWALQNTSGSEAGSWPWIEFQNEPWEAPDSAYFGAVLAALAVGRTPAVYRQRADIQPALTRLRGYLARAYVSEPLLNRIDLLWASGRWPELIAPPRREALLAEIWAHRRPDGGWNEASLMPGWHRHDGSAEPSDSDGYATGLVILALEVSGVPRSDAHLRRGLTWLRTYQSRWTGAWSAPSMNRRFSRNPLHDRMERHFMDDAATAYAVLALTQTGAPADAASASTAGQSAAPDRVAASH